MDNRMSKNKDRISISSVLTQNDNSKMEDDLSEKDFLEKFSVNRFRTYSAFLKLFPQFKDKEYQMKPYEIDQLFQRVVKWDWKAPLAYHLACDGHRFSANELIKYGNPTSDDNTGWTLAHEMAKQGHIFLVDDLELLGNPADFRDLTISDIMILNGHKFTEAEMKRLGIDYEDFRYTACAWFYEDPKETMNEPITDICLKCGGKFSSTELTELNPYNRWDSSFRLHTCENCHWWVVRYYSFDWGAGMSWEFSVLITGVEKPFKPESGEEQEPWKKFLRNGNYYHDLPVTDEILRLFPTRK